MFIYLIVVSYALLLNCFILLTCKLIQYDRVFSVYAVGRTVTKCFLKWKGLSGGRLMLVLHLTIILLFSKTDHLPLCSLILISLIIINVHLFSELHECFFLLISDVSSA